MARKKIVFVLVEGPSDEEALGAVLSKFYDKEFVYIKVMHCDITTRNDVNVSNAATKIVGEIKKYAEDYHFTNKHFKEIIHITDTDGVFIPRENVVFSKGALSPIYTLENILTVAPEKIIQRNVQKSTVINRLLSCDKMWNIPYGIYYMSTNLDHVLFNRQNSTDDEKENNAYLFAENYKDNVVQFVELMSNSDFSVCEDYMKSWKYIIHGTNSLKRHTNLGLKLITDR